MNGQPRASKPVQTHPVKHVPQRMCVVCRSTAAKRALTRLVRVVDRIVPDRGPDVQNALNAARLQIDPTGKRDGRGAYLCDQAVCWQRASDTDVLAKALRMTLSDADRFLLRAMTPTADSAAMKRDPKSIPVAPADPRTAAKPPQP